MVKSVRVLETGHCFHPEFVVRKGGGLRAGRFPSNVVVLDHAKEGIILFDAGYPSDFAEITRRMPEMLYRIITPVTTSEALSVRNQLSRLGIGTGDVRHIILSHLHADHIGDIRHFPRATFHVDPEGYRHYIGLSRFSQVRAGFLRALLPDDFESRIGALSRDRYVPGNFGLGDFSRGIDLFRDGSVIVIPLPGHMRGHIGIQVSEMPGRKFLFIGDAAWRLESIVENAPPSSVTRLVIDDWSAYRRTLDELHRLYLARPDLQIVPCHCEKLADPGSPVHVV